MTPEISIIMPCYNAEAYIGASLQSVLQQHFTDFELIIVNDGSTDASADILRDIKDPRVRVIDQTNAGVITARNRGLAEARGELVAFLDSDDTWHPEFLSRLHAALRTSPEACLAYCGWQNLGLPGQRGDPFIPPDYEGPAKLEQLLESCRWPIHAALVKRNEVERAGGFDPQFPTAEDYWLWLRIAPFKPIVRVPLPLAYYHHHGEQRSTARNRVQKAVNRWQIRLEFLRRYPEVRTRLDKRRLRELVHGTLLAWGYRCYWNDDLPAARSIFRIVMKTGYGSLRDWVYMLPAWLPLSLHTRLLQLGRRSLPPEPR